MATACGWLSGSRSGRSARASRRASSTAAITVAILAGPSPERRNAAGPAPSRPATPPQCTSSSRARSSAERPGRPVRSSTAISSASDSAGPPLRSSRSRGRSSSGRSRTKSAWRAIGFRARAIPAAADARQPSTRDGRKRCPRSCPLPPAAGGDPGIWHVPTARRREGGMHAPPGGVNGFTQPRARLGDRQVSTWASKPLGLGGRLRGGLPNGHHPQEWEREAGRASPYLGTTRRDTTANPPARRRR